uniref:Tarag, isoform E n=1 Tax=Drosophila melanogaster TaxID=7227 RepID=A0A0B4LGH0_DROME|nr:tarag, isoform E [Drosophila melanogaster]AHN56224.1 tarag, isoform E [Drosophila melanogaster]|eukprot:NP_001286426.1 uncharacterized protein Dmel_CG12866, isoform E [Drosophila melanogaster]
MSRNRRRSFPSSQYEDKTAAAQPSGSSLRSQSLSRLDISVQNSSIYYNDTRNTRPQMVSVAVGTVSTDILNGRTSFLSLSQSHGSEVDLPSFYESFNPTFLPKLPIRRFPHMLVGASNEPEISKNQPAIPPSRPIEPISEVPFVEPAFEKKYSRTRGFSKELSTHRDNENEYIESTDEVSQMLSFTSYTDEYDRAEPLITKTQKFYKKRSPLIPKYDSEDSYVVPKETDQQESGLSFNVTTVQLADTASPESFSEYDGNRTRKQSFDMESKNSKESFDFSRGGRRLGSGMVFVNLYGDTTGRRIRLGNHGAVLPRPADNRWFNFYHWGLIAIHCPGSGCLHIVGIVCGQCPDWLLLH